MIQVGNTTYFQNYEWYEGLEDGNFKEEALKEKLYWKDHGDRRIEKERIFALEEYWWGKKEEEESREDAWSNYLPNDDNDAIQVNQERFNDHEPIKDDDDDDDIGDMDDYLIPNDASYYVDEEEERFKERRSKLLGIPYKKPLTFKSKKFKVIKYSLGQAEEYLAIKEYEYDIWLRTKENVSRVYQEIFHKKDEGWILNTVYLTSDPYWFTFLTGFNTAYLSPWIRRIDPPVQEVLNVIDESGGFTTEYPGSHAIFQPYRISDHSPAAVNENWEIYVAGHNMFCLVKRLKHMKKPMRKLLHAQGNIHDRVTKLRTELDQVQTALDKNPSSTMLREEDGVYLTAFTQALLDEERFLKQKSKIDWLKVGNSNSAFFHRSVKERDGLNDIVSDNQSAFILGRSIWDNILLTQELMHNYHLNRGPPRCACKIDIQKAYDTVCWKFLNEVLIGFGFHEKMIKWIMACVTSTSFSININGDLNEYFKGKRGLRQRDLISPYLFTLVMEILTLILKCKIRKDDAFKYHNKCDKQKIVNICFTDDLILFVRAEVHSAKITFDVLEEFKEASGLVPSTPKSTVFLCNVLDQVKSSILNLMPFEEGILPIKYLGVPLISTRLLHKDTNNVTCIVGRLIVAAMSYYVWQERNHRVHGKNAKTQEDLTNIIVDVIRSKLASISFKKKMLVDNMKRIWKLSWLE
ncbi:putative reverse transcriptase domain, reverse transcriptase zinc-binding domain protein [Tanacetum coccineum]